MSSKLTPYFHLLRALLRICCDTTVDVSVHILFLHVLTWPWGTNVTAVWTRWVFRIHLLKGHKSYKLPFRNIFFLKMCEDYYWNPFWFWSTLCGSTVLTQLQAVLWPLVWSTNNATCLRGNLWLSTNLDISYSQQKLSRGQEFSVCTQDLFGQMGTLKIRNITLLL